MTSERYNSHPATSPLVRLKTPHPATIARPKTQHPATIAQPKASRIAIQRMVIEGDVRCFFAVAQIRRGGAPCPGGAVFGRGLNWAYCVDNHGQIRHIFHATCVNIYGGALGTMAKLGASVCPFCDGKLVRGTGCSDEWILSHPDSGTADALLTMFADLDRKRDLKKPRE